jgi:hypothetical protein
MKPWILPIEEHFIKIYGCRRTGTNFIFSLIDKNCLTTRCFDNQFGGKHTFPISDLKQQLKKLKNQHSDYKDYFEEVYYSFKSGTPLNSIVIIKNPYSWYWSIKRFVDKKINQSFNFVNEYNYYNNFYSTLQDFSKNPNIYGEHFRKVFVLRYEDLLKYPELNLKLICEEFGVPKPKKIIIPNKVTMSKEFTASQRSFYLREDHFDLPKDIILNINRIIDWDLMTFYGYKKVNI